jgi:superfamily II DNA or RNA helicase
MATPKILLSDKVYVPTDEVNMASVKKNYTKNLYEERACKVCEYRQDRHSFMCDTCPAFKERIVLFSKKNIKGVSHVGLPIGDRINIERKAKIDYNDFKIVDRRTFTLLNSKIKFTAKLRPVQKQLKESFLKKRYGLIIAPPRTGKSITALATTIELGNKIVFLAKQHEFLNQIMDHIHGNEEEGIPKCTNLPELEKKYKKKLYGFPKKEEDFKNFEIMFMTYQSLISDKKGKQRLKWLNKYIGTVAIDEVHTANANEFSKVISKLKARYKFGVTATRERKDRKEFIVEALLGPVVAETDIEALIPTVHLHKTELKYKHFNPGPAAWVYCMKHVTGDKKRNKQIVKMVMKDLKNGHNIVIPVLYKKHVLELQSMINKEFGSKICEIFVGGGGKKNKEGRKDILTRAKANKTRVIVGIRSLLQLGLNVPQWSAIYEIAPISNKPNLKQETKRVCTPLEGKRPPIVRLFVDFAQPQSLGCARSTVKHMLQLKYTFSSKEEQKELLNEVLGSGKRSKEVDELTSDILGPQRRSSLRMEL